MKYHIITIGKIKEKYLTAGIEEFLKRLRPYGQVEITALPEEKMPENPSAAQKRQVLDKEGEKLLRHVREGSHLFVLDVQGQKKWRLNLPIWQCMAAVKCRLSSAAPLDCLMPYANGLTAAFPLVGLR